jgi:uncharacterized small protein (DUF1192 family)
VASPELPALPARRICHGSPYRSSPAHPAEVQPPRVQASSGGVGAEELRLILSGMQELNARVSGLQDELASVKASIDASSLDAGRHQHSRGSMLHGHDVAGERGTEAGIQVDDEAPETFRLPPPPGVLGGAREEGKDGGLEGEDWGTKGQKVKPESPRTSDTSLRSWAQGRQQINSARALVCDTPTPPPPAPSSPTPPSPAPSSPTHSSTHAATPGQG